MSLSEIQFPEENPFYRIKVRQIFLWFVLFLFLVVVGYAIFFAAIAPIVKINFNKNPDPIIAGIAGINLFLLLDISIGLVWNYSGINKYDLSLSLVEQLRDRVWIGIIFLAISTPILIRFIHQNWHRINELLPYFTNSSE